MTYSLWECHDGTQDILDDEGAITYCNVPPLAAKEFVRLKEVESMYKVLCEAHDVLAAEHAAMRALIHVWTKEH